MESIDRQRTALPPIRMLDVEKVKREEAEYQSRHTNMSSAAMTSPVTTSPTFQYPSGPPPPYSQPAPNVHAKIPPPSDTRPSPGGRRMSEDDHTQSQAKQSLPSIHEALGVEQPSSYQAQFHSQQPYQAPAPSTAPSSPAAVRRSFGMEPPPPPPTVYAQTPRSPYVQYRHEMSPSRAHEFVERHPTYTSQQPPPPLRPIRTPHSPIQHAAHYSHPHPSSEPSAHTGRYPPHTSSMAHPSLPYGYSQYPPDHAAYPPRTPTSSANVYQPSVMHAAPIHPEAGRTLEAQAPGTMSESGRQYYGESVKRHLDSYDFENALNEVVDNSVHIHEAVRQCGVRLHQTQRSGPVPGTLPGLADIDALMLKSRQTYDALARMRGHIVAQEAAYYQQAQEQQFKAHDDTERSDSVHHCDDSKGDGFAGPEAKKRRGRAAPPGRCHSCNRAETPEWRRGPDGARTLCNACGLHYAKLTRKANGASKASISSSNLRPKSGTSEQPESRP